MEKQEINTICSFNVDIDAEAKSFGVETKFNDYIGMQKRVVEVLRDEGFLNNNVVTNKESGMQIAITTKGIKETLGSGNRFQSLPRELKKLKVATLRRLPQIIEEAKLIEDNVANMHGKNTKFAYLETPIEINGEEANVKINVKKQAFTNKFWIHNVVIEKSPKQLSLTNSKDIHELLDFSKDSIASSEQDVTSQNKVLKEIEKNSDTLRPALTQELNERMSSSKNSKAQDSAEVNEKRADRMNNQVLGSYEVFSEYEMAEAQEFAIKKGWNIAESIKYYEEADHYEYDIVVYRDIEELNESARTGVLTGMISKVCEFEKLSGMPEQNRYVFREDCIAELQERYKFANEWVNDCQGGWIADEKGNLKVIPTEDLQIIAEYEDDLNINPDKRLIERRGEELIPKKDITKEAYFESRRKALEFTWDEEIYISIEADGFRPTDNLIKNIGRFQRMEGRNYTLKELAELHQNKQDFKDNPTKQKVFEDIVKECQEQELQKTSFMKMQMQMDQMPVQGM